MRKILLVIDMQNDFIDGSLGTLEAEGIIDKVVQMIYKYPLEDIIATRDTHGKDYLETQEGRKLPVPHCIKGTLGCNLHPRITAALNGATIMGKSTFASKSWRKRWRRWPKRMSWRLQLWASAPISASSPMRCSSRRFSLKRRSG